MVKMAQEAMYKNPIFLNSVAHKDVKIDPKADFDYARNMNSVVIAGQEFLEAAKFYPVVFTRTPTNDIIPVALLGVRANQNLMMDEDGKWQEGAYVPAFFRRYPFILADNVGQDGSFAVCVDAGYAGYDAKEGISLFDDNGEMSNELKGIVEFLKNYHTQFEVTKAMINLLEENKLFKDVSAKMTLSAGEQFAFTNMMMVDEQAMQALDDEKATELFRKGFLAWIYAHLYSLSNFKSLAAKAGKSTVAAEKKEKKSKIKTAAKEAEAGSKGTKKDT
jgi:hypothetical protein